MNKKLIKMILRLLSIVVNYGIYFFRRIFLRQSKQKAMRQHYEGYIKAKEDAKNIKNIAIVNTSFIKYTETFIREKIKNVDKSKFTVMHYYGEIFPTHFAKTGHLLSSSETVLKLYELAELITQKPTNYYLKKAFYNHLKNKNIKLVFAEFGTIGIAIYEVCKNANIPLIVTLRGYDIHHKNFFDAKKDKYLEMFEYCSLIIGVSKDILNKVHEYGFKKKTLYFHSTINTSLFSYSNHKDIAPIFLSVGRFAETKSPHLTILAFKEVLKTIPDAELRMIGKDGGGELFEACHILVRALKIEDKVHFLGVLSPEEVAQEMKNARVFVQHSLTTPLMGDKEGTPVSVMEAMASGLPIVATKHAGIAEIMQDGASGVLVEEYDYLAMAKAMIKVCESDELVQLLGKGAFNAICKDEHIYNNDLILTAIIESHRLK